MTHPVVILSETLRAEEPVLWAICSGLTSTKVICFFLRMTQGQVEREITSLMSQGLIKNHFGKAYILNKAHPRYGDLEKVKRLNEKIEQKLIETWPELAGIGSSPAIRKTIRAEKRANPNQLTRKQQELLDFLKENFKGKFGAGTVARALGYTGSQYTKVALQALERKGYLTGVEGHNGGAAWILSSDSQ